MRRVFLNAPVWVVLSAFFIVGTACKPDGPVIEPSAALLFPTLASGQDQLELIRLRGAGNVPLVTLRRQAGTWRVDERGGWPADAAKVSQYLFVLSQARRSEPKTRNPAMYARLGVQAMAVAGADGAELELSGGGKRSRLLVGHEHVKFDSNYVRVDGEPQTWLTDLPVTFERDPGVWVDHALVDLPLARIASVKISDADGKSFSLSHRDDRFRLDDAPSAAMHDSHRGDDLAGVLNQLKFEDVATDDGKQVALRRVEFIAIDGTQLTIGLWKEDARLWARVGSSIDERRAADWLRTTGGKVSAASASRALAASWQHKFAGRKFLLPDAVATTLQLGHDEILQGSTPP